jgi:hypothetical protein
MTICKETQLLEEEEEEEKRERGGSIKCGPCVARLEHRTMNIQTRYPNMLKAHSENPYSKTGA